MNETSKANIFRAALPAYQRAFRGAAIDIGAGNDPLKPCDLFPELVSVEAFDLADGNAQIIDQLRPAESYDLVYSSHCLEHMVDPTAAVLAWWKLVKPGGHLCFAVPHENLYEQGRWPSRFNPDHKTTWRIGTEPSWSPVSISMDDWLPMLSLSAECDRLCVSLRREGYDFSLLGKGIDQTMRGALAQIDVLIRKKIPKPEPLRAAAAPA